jgi:hypothetical protein
MGNRLAYWSIIIKAKFLRILGNVFLAAYLEANGHVDLLPILKNSHSQLDILDVLDVFELQVIT